MHKGKYKKVKDKQTNKIASVVHGFNLVLLDFLARVSDYREKVSPLYRQQPPVYM
jgi:hypothetical protein